MYSSLYSLYNRNMKVLVVEDEVRIAENIRKGLEQRAFVVDVARDGEEGYDLASSEEYDVIVLDRMLPAMDGMKVCALLRAKQCTTPILMLTARGQVGDRVDGLNGGVDDYLVKPFAFMELVARIQVLGRRPRAAVNTVLTVDTLTLDHVTYEVRRAGVLISLSPKEFALLDYLMRNKNKVVSKDQIVAHVWSFESDVLPNTAQVYIGYLRKKIDEQFPDFPPLIHTIRGYGYQLGVRDKE